jgi:hypothetical protein
MRVCGSAAEVKAARAGWRVCVVTLAAGLGVVGAAGSAGGLSFWRAWLATGEHPPGAEGLMLQGGDGASLPLATAEVLGLDPVALHAADQTARRAGATTLLVARRGHLVRETADGAGEGRVRSALLSRLVLGAGGAMMQEQAQGGLHTDAPAALLRWSAAAQGRGSARNPWSTRSRARFGPAPAPTSSAGLTPPELAASIATNLWQPLAAADAVYETDARHQPRLHAGLWMRPRDGLALAVALAEGGQVGGVRLMTPGRADHLLGLLDDGTAPRGAEPFGARAARVLRDDEGTRLYFFPAQQLVILLVGADEAGLADETELAHQVLRGIVDPPRVVPAPGARDMVPLH